MKGLTKDLPCTEGAARTQDTSEEAPIRVLAPSTYSWPSGPPAPPGPHLVPTWSLVSMGVRDSELRSSHLHHPFLHLAGIAASHRQ